MQQDTTACWFKQSKIFTTAATFQAGKFHAWGLMRDVDGLVVSAAIVEDERGLVNMVHPENVHFGIDPYAG
jgi:hypothetical protein